MKKLITLAISILMMISVTACSGSSNVVATVDKTEITKDEYQKMLNISKITAESQYGKEIWDQEVSEGVKFRDQMKDSILEQLVGTEVIYSQAKKDNLVPTEKEVKKSVDEIKKNIESNEDYKKQLDEIGIDDTFLSDQEKKSIALQRYQEAFYKNTKVTESDLKKYYDSHKEEFNKDQVEASHILIKTVDDANKELSKAKKEAAKKKAEEVLKKVKDGGDFAKLAKEYSQDSSAESGGSLGFFSKGDMVEPFEKSAFSLKVGEISDIVETQYGYHIIKVTNKKKDVTSFEDAKDTMKQSILEEKYSQEIEKLTKAAKIEKNEKVIKKVTF
ncbi:peptidylprolyl isomerase [Metaclostridioides mangenotii]|uniref:peptidylprolyl isomerase n=1 Tax=Metaclostridioides mangenotii TaxID=1540 RepID=UPI00047FD220|nr:peptidylprolyl isomerase [Clostridioides mangenotii]